MQQSVNCQGKPQGIISFNTKPLYNKKSQVKKFLQHKQRKQYVEQQQRMELKLQASATLEQNKMGQIKDMINKMSLQIQQDPSESTYFGVIAQLVKLGMIKDTTSKLWLEFYQSYKKACTVDNTNPFPQSYVMEVFVALFYSVLREFLEPYEFPSYHQKHTSPINYYEFGVKLMAGVIDFQKSVLGNVQTLNIIEQQLKKGENVIFLANHQSEADPAIISCMFTYSNPYLAEKLIMVAGDRVVTDPMCKPFARGRDLFCVHSKKHMYDDPDLVSYKQSVNKKTVMVMQRKLNEGGVFMWIAPSGGRDRPDPQNRYIPAKFDPSSTGLIYQLVTRAKKPGHIYPFAMHCAELMPPPKAVEKAIGEARTTEFSPAGLSVGEEISLTNLLEGIGEQDKNSRQDKLNRYGYDMVMKEWLDLDKVLQSPSEIANFPKFSQPWYDNKI